MQENLYKTIMPYKVTIADINYGNHMGNSAYFNLIHEARLFYLKSLGGFSEMHLDENVGIIMLNANIDFKAQIYHNDSLNVKVRIAEMKNSSFVMEYALYKNDMLAAKATTTLVAFNYKENKSARIPQLFIQKVKEHETHLT